MSYYITRTHEIHCGHRVYGHEGKCKNLHGHSYVFELFVRSTAEHWTEELDTLGRVVDFSVVKSLLCQWLEDNWDHRMLIWKGDPAAKQLLQIDDTIVIVDFNPTAENIAAHLVDLVGPLLLKDHDVELFRVTVHETGKCSATYTQLT